MLRMYLMQIWFNLSDEGIEDSIYDSYAMCTFMHIDFNEQQAPDATTLLWPNLGISGLYGIVRSL
jgi:IS5 family transposase